MEARGKLRNKSYLSTAGTWYAALFMTTVEALQHLLFADCTVTNSTSGFNSLPSHTLNHCQSSRSSVQSVNHSTSRKRFYFAYDFDIESVSSWHRADCKQWPKADTETGWNTLLPSDTGHSLVFVSGRNGKSTICSCWQHISAEGLSHIFSSLATVAAKVQWPCDFVQGDHTQGDRIASWGLTEKINGRVGSENRNRVTLQ